MREKEHSDQTSLHTWDMQMWTEERGREGGREGDGDEREKEGCRLEKRQGIKD